MSDPYGSPSGSNPYGQNPYGQQPPAPQPYGGGGSYGGGGPQGYGGGGGGFGGQPPKTDGVSIASFVLSLLCCTGLIGLILGFVGLSRTKNGQRKGRGFAIAGIVLGILSVLLAIGGVVIVATGVLGERINDLKDGQCLTGNGLDKSADEGVSGIHVVDCTDEHDAQVIATKTLSSEEADDFEYGNQSQIVDYCTPMLDSGEAGLLLDPKYYVIALTQEKTPSSGDKIVCVITLADGGSLDEKLP